MMFSEIENKIKSVYPDDTVIFPIIEILTERELLNLVANGGFWFIEKTGEEVASRSLGVYKVNENYKIYYLKPFQADATVVNEVFDKMRELTKVLLADRTLSDIALISKISTIKYETQSLLEKVFFYTGIIELSVEKTIN